MHCLYVPVYIMSSFLCACLSCLPVCVFMNYVSLSVCLCIISLVCVVVSCLFMYKCIMSPCMCSCIRSPCMCACWTCLLKHMPVYHVSLWVRLCIMSRMSQPRLFKPYTKIIVSQSIWDMLNTKFNMCPNQHKGFVFLNQSLSCLSSQGIEWFCKSLHSGETWINS